MSLSEPLARRAVLLRRLDRLLERAEQQGNVPLMLRVLTLAAELAGRPAP